METTATDRQQQKQSPAGHCSPVGHEPPPPGMIARLREHFSPRRVTYIADALTAGELAVVSDLGDALIIARIKRMPDRRLRRYERLEPAAAEDRKLYNNLQCRWLAEETYLLSTRLGRQPTHGELFADFMRNHNGLRVRAYFAMKFPRRVRPTRGKAA